jgi:hypothetical protein
VTYRRTGSYGARTICNGEGVPFTAVHRIRFMQACARERKGGDGLVRSRARLAALGGKAGVRARRRGAARAPAVEACVQATWEGSLSIPCCPCHAGKGGTAWCPRGVKGRTSTC